MSIAALHGRLHDGSPSPWSIRPARILWISVLGTKLVATLIAVYGLFMTPLGWQMAGFVWGYAVLCALVTDPIKLLAYRILDPAKAQPTTTGAAATNTVDFTPRIAARA